MAKENSNDSGGIIAFAIVCAIASAAVGSQKATGSMITQEFGEGWYHAVNAVSGFLFAFSVAKFLRILGQVLQIAGALAWFLVVASISLTISGGYLVLQFYRVFVW